MYLILYVDNIMLVSKDTDMFTETKHFLFGHFDMKDLGEASYILGIQILRDRANGVLRLSQKMYIDHVLKRFNMQSCSPGKAPIVKGDKFSRSQCPQNDHERN